MNAAPDSTLMPSVPAEADGDLRAVLRAPWARRWLLVVAVLMVAWLGVAGWLDARRQHARVRSVVGAAAAQARAGADRVEGELRQGLAQLDGVARMLARLPSVRQAMAAADPPATLADEPVPTLRSALQAQPALAALDDFLAASSAQLGADEIDVLDAAGNCIASSDAGTSDSHVGQHLRDPGFFYQTRLQHGARRVAVSERTGLPAMRFAASIVEDGRFIGTVVVSRDTRALAALAGQDGVFVVDPQGVVVMAGDPGLLLHALPDAPVLALGAPERLARYRADVLPVLNLAPWDEAVAPGLRRIGADLAPQVLEHRAMGQDDLDVYVAQPVPELAHLVREHGFDFALMALAGLGAIALVAAGLGGWRSRRSVIEAIARIGQANRKLSVEVAERQRAEVLLRESREYLVVHEARLRALLRSLPEQVWMKDRAGAYLAVNAAFERFQGILEADILGKTDLDMAPGERSLHYATQDQATLAAAEPLVFTETELAASGGGGKRRLEVTKMAVRDDRGEVIGVVGVARDATEIHAAELALNTSEARFRATFETAGDAILIIRQGLVVDCNARAADVLGGDTREDVLGQRLERFADELQPDGTPSAQRAEQYLSDLRQGGMRTVEWRCRRLDGTPFDAEITLSLFRLNDQNLLQAVLRDVSERQRMISALEAARDEAERANRSKSVFLANMSHEIRTPLNAVLGFTQLLMADRKLPDEAQARLRVIHGAGNRLLGLINDVLDLAKIESGGLQVQAAPFDLTQELRDIEALYASHARAKGLALHAELSLPPHAVVEGDRNKVGQIVTNLLGNALKFTERGHVGLHVWQDPDAPSRVVFEVSDTGPGITEADVADLFVPFRQGAAGQEKGGTGLGLALSRDMARAMGGDLALAGTSAAGTRVRFWLPLPPGQLPATGPAIGAGAQVLDASTPCTALVIEDDAHSREVLVDLLRGAGCTVVEAVDGLEGLERCRDGRFDIVFSDIRMPHMNGVELIERLRADPATARLPVVAVSASSLEHERRFYIDNGFQDFIGKPYPFQSVYRALVAHAGVVLHPAVAPVVVNTDVPGPAALTPAARDQLRALADAASRGQPAAVGRCLAAIRPEAIGGERWRSFDEAAQAYDFQLLEERVAALLSASGAPAVAG